MSLPLNVEHQSLYNKLTLTDVWQDRLIHYVSSEGVIYLVMADDAVGRRMPFGFLAEVERRVSFITPYTGRTQADRLVHQHVLDR